MADKKLHETKRYKKALEWVRSINIPGKPHGLPDQKEFTRMVAERPGVYEEYDPHTEQQHDMPEEYELAYMQVKLERAKTK
jgi:hypothetical protein